MEYGGAPLLDRAPGCARNPFHYPDQHVSSFERHLTACTDPQGTLWCAVRTETGAGPGIGLFRLRDYGPARRYFIPAGPGSLRPALCAGGDGRIYALWTQRDGDAWRVMCAVKEPGEDPPRIEVLHESPSACIHPAVCAARDRVWTAWSGLDPASSTSAIYGMPHGDGILHEPAKLIGGPFNAFRPSLAPAGEGVFVCCDRGHDGVYEIAWTLADGMGAVGSPNILGRQGQRWMEPSAATGPDGVIHMAFTVIRDVIDEEHDIIDHDVGAAYGRIAGGRCVLIPEDPGEIPAARLREGLLGQETYVAYFGSRRKVFPAVLADGSVWLAWEFRYEKDRTGKGMPGEFHSGQHYGWLAGRRLEKEGWGQTRILHEGGTLYAIPASQRGKGITAAWIRQSDLSAIPRISGGILGTVAAPAPEPESPGPSRWKPFATPAIDRQRMTVDTGEGEYRLYWADTHVHSRLSPDAEGEPDELILFARDIAALDAMAFVDNDYYPHKALTQGEWALHQALAALYTREGRFVVFPGYEYTCHDEGLEPDFNHRYVLYPRRGPLLRRIDEGSRSVQELSRKLASTGALLFAHHPSWVLTGAEHDRNVEVCSSWRVCIEEKDFIRKRLGAGDRFGFIGSSDTHRAVPGLGGALTGLYARELTPESLFDAYRNRRTIATQGGRIWMDFTAGGIFIGGEGSLPAPPDIRLRAGSSAPIEYAEILRDGEVLRRFPGEGCEIRAEFTDTTAAPGRHFYFARVKTIGDPSWNEPGGDPARYHPFIGDRGPYRHNFARARGPFAWTSPVWLHLAP